MTKLNYHTRRNGHEKYKSKQIKQILPNIIVDNMLGINASVFTAALQANTGKNLLYQMLQQTLDHVCFLFVHLYPLNIFQVFLERKKERKNCWNLTEKTVFCVISFETLFW